MDAETRDRIETIFVECVVALFEAFGVRAEPVPPSDKRSAAMRSTLSIIGFAGKPLRGSLVFTADEALLLRTYTHCLDADADVPDLDASDWSAELANQLLGRIQNKLQVQGIVLYPSTPTSLSGLEWRVGDCPRNVLSIAHTFHAGGEDFLEVRFEAVAVADVAFDTSQKDSELRREGSLIFF